MSTIEKLPASQLFRSQPLQMILNNRERQIGNLVAGLSDAEVATGHDADVANSIISRLDIRPIALQADSRRTRANDDGTVTVTVPFEGSPELLYCEPSTNTMNPPMANVQGLELEFGYRVHQPDADTPQQIKAANDADLGVIQGWLDNTNHDVNQRLDAWRQKVMALIAGRRSQQEGARQLQQGLDDAFAS